MDSKADPFGQTFKFFDNLDPGKGLIALTGGTHEGNGEGDYFKHLKTTYDSILEVTRDPKVGPVKNVMIPVLATGSDLALGLMFDADVPVMYEVSRLISHVNAASMTGMHYWLVADTPRDRKSFCKMCQANIGAAAG